MYFLINLKSMYYDALHFDAEQCIFQYFYVCIKESKVYGCSFMQCH